MLRPTILIPLRRNLPLRRVSLGLAAALMLLFLGDLALIVAVPLPGFDRSTALRIQAFEWGPLEAVMSATNWLADVRQAIFAAVVIGVLAFFNRRSALVVLLGVPASVATQLLKLVVERPRPPANVLHVLQVEYSYGFPSGHATFFAWLVPLFIFAVHPRIPRLLRIPTYILGALIVAFGAVGRVWAGAHWPTDVVGGVLLGTAWALVVISLTALAGADGEPRSGRPPEVAV